MTGSDDRNRCSAVKKTARHEYDATRLPPWRKWCNQAKRPTNRSCHVRAEAIRASYIPVLAGTCLCLGVTTVIWIAHKSDGRVDTESGGDRNIRRSRDSCWNDMQKQRLQGSGNAKMKHSPRVSVWRELLEILSASLQRRSFRKIE